MCEFDDRRRECSRFWPFVDTLHVQRRPLDRAGYLELMERLGRDAAAIRFRSSPQFCDEPRKEEAESSLADLDPAEVSRYTVFALVYRADRP